MLHEIAAGLTITPISTARQSRGAAKDRAGSGLVFRHVSHVPSCASSWGGTAHDPSQSELRKHSFGSMTPVEVGSEPV